MLAMAATLMLASTARAQPVAAPMTRLVGFVNDPYGPARDADVELLREGVVLRRARTTDGRFELHGLPHGAYQLRVRKLGIAPFEGRAVLASPVDTIRVTMGSIRAALDSAAVRERERLLAAARARPRHWNCRTTEAERRSTAESAFAALTRGDYSKRYAIPADSGAFHRDFRRVVSARECRRLAAALDRDFGLIDDDLVVFRVGRMYFLPGYGSGGMMVGLDGKVIGVFIID
jgi:hypothetical protein